MIDALEFERRALELNPSIRPRVRRERPEQQWCKGHKVHLPAGAFKHGPADAYCDDCRSERKRIRQDPALHAEWKRRRYRARKPLLAKTLERLVDPRGFKERQRRARRDKDYRRRLPGNAVPTRPMPGACECCGREPIAKKLSRDHEHGTDIFRGWLCAPCNLAIGRLGDNVEGLQRAITYLERAYANAPEEVRWLMG